uniref:Uncharacterized protein n=1 Tax=Nelumbo nucifera TaxID=4432 RepID=A0A822XXY6_NELNU|nr:TPA_asm: hypothetical protein HUJ06_027962 [Nelumbo nucifera]
MQDFSTPTTNLPLSPKMEMFPLSPQLKSERSQSKYIKLTNKSIRKFNKKEDTERQQKMKSCFGPISLKPL